MTEVAQYRPLRAAGDTSGPETDEALFISALLLSGQFTPERFQVEIEDLTCWKPLWQFCETYQAREGCAPPMELIAQRFPTFELTPKVGCVWTAGQLLRASQGRKMRIALREATLKLDDRNPDPEAAMEALAQIRPMASTKPPIDGLAPWLEEAEPEGLWIPVPYKTLQYATGGLGRGTLTLLGARPGEGKTHIGSVFIAAAVEAGARVGLMSLEMPAASMRKRVNRNLCRGDKADLLSLETPGLDHMRVMGKIKERTPGSLDIIDPSFGRITPNVVRAFLEEHDLVVVDHVGLLGTNAGGRAVDDWRNMGGISNQLIEDKLSTGTPILGITQLNRKAEEGDRFQPPGKPTVAGADTLLQDADTLITMRRFSTHGMVMGAVKNREGPPCRWYTRFDPATCDFSEVDYAKAKDIYAEDESNA